MQFLEPVSSSPRFPKDATTREELFMRHSWVKALAAAGLIGTLAIASATPSQARNGAGAFAAGVGVGLLGGAAIASSGYGAYPSYGYAPGYYAYGTPGHHYGWRHRYRHGWAYR
jgi:hypothetical protein